MRVLLYGGTFDPPHFGHIHNLQCAAECCKPDHIVVMPAGVPPHKAASSTPAAVRMEMCRCFTNHLQEKIHASVEISDWEIKRAANGDKNYSLYTLQMLAERYPGAELFMAVGSDMLSTFQQWYQWQQVMQLCTLVVQSRSEGDLPSLEQAAQALRQQGGKVLLSLLPALEVSSTEIRSGTAAPDTIPPEVYSCILKYHLYRQDGFMNQAEARELARTRLSVKRFTHTVNVRDMAVSLAKCYGADEKKAAVAALLHDTAKELPEAQLLQILQDNAIISGDAVQRPRPVWHGICAAILAQTQWGVSDREILSAVAAHTAGKPDMSLLDIIIYMADLTSAERSFPEAAILRKQEFENLDAAFAQALRYSLFWLKKDGKPVDPYTVKAYEQYCCRAGDSSQHDGQ